MAIFPVAVDLTLIVLLELSVHILQAIYTYGAYNGFTSIYH